MCLSTRACASSTTVTDLLTDDCRHSRERGNPVTLTWLHESRWIPAFAGMTSKRRSAQAVSCLDGFSEVPEPVVRVWSLPATIASRRWLSRRPGPPSLVFRPIGHALPGRRAKQRRDRAEVGLARQRLR
ncbi:hypothetical protein [Lysobacter gummosus]|uniref:hypothetical protein n=1 Tax=Lysobacter gummosus TaxID=262324 RepID=UPI00364389F0